MDPCILDPSSQRLSLGELVGDVPLGELDHVGRDRHADRNLLFGDVPAQPSKDLIRSVVDERQGIGDIVLKTDGGVLELCEAQKLARTGDLKPFHITGETLVAIGPGRKKNGTARFTFRPLDLPPLQVIDKVIGLGQGGKAYCSELAESGILIRLCHGYLPKIVTLPYRPTPPIL
jgi:hypothetical protein